MSVFLRLLLGALLPFSCAAAAADLDFAPAAAGMRVVYRGVTLIDGTGAPPRPDVAVITNGERIEQVLDETALTAEVLAGAEQVDLSGRFLLPGLIDSHQHLATPPQPRESAALLRRALFSGVTGMRVMADDLRSVAELDRAARAGEIAAPDLYYAAVFAGPGFFADRRTAAVSAGYRPGEAPWAQAVDAGTDVPLAISRARGTGATAIKIYSDLPPDLVRSLAAEAHRQDLQVWVHGMVFPTPPVDVLAAGPDVVSHTCYLAYQVLEQRPQSYAERFPVDPALFDRDHPVMRDLFRTMRERGIVLDPTLRVYRETERVAPPERPPYCGLELAARLTAQAHRERVMIAAGTDSYAPPQSPYPALFDELELLVELVGMSPLEAISAATRIGATTIGRGDALGVVAPGRRADFVILERDPVADIANMRSVLLTVKRGRRFDRDDYRPISPEEAVHD